MCIRDSLGAVGTPPDIEREVERGELEAGLHPRDGDGFDLVTGEREHGLDASSLGVGPVASARRFYEVLVSARPPRAYSLGEGDA